MIDNIFVSYFYNSPLKVFKELMKNNSLIKSLIRSAQVKFLLSLGLTQSVHSLNFA
jgi:hypothetical protein